MRPNDGTDNKIVHVDFVAMGRARQLRKAARAEQPSAFDPLDLTVSLQRFNGARWNGQVDLRAPWLIRLFAVVLILGLSLLIL